MSRQCIISSADVENESKKTQTTKSRSKKDSKTKGKTRQHKPS